MAWPGRWSWHLGALLALGCAGGDELQSTPPPQLEAHLGYPPTTSWLGASLGDNLLKACHATLVHPGWALTAAHCLSGVEPDSRGTLRDFHRGFSADQVEFYPGAHVSGATRLEAPWRREDFVAAHDLALVPLRPPVLDVSPVAAWQPQEGCSLRAGAGIIGELGIAGADGEALTVEASLLGQVEAATLLGAGHSGWLVAAQGPSVGPGDSGSGMSADSNLLEAAAPGCEPVRQRSPERVLIGVVQDANPSAPSSAFGLVPVYGADHARWLQSVLDATPSPADPAPPRLPP